MTTLPPIVPGQPKMLHGGDYNPEQWLDRPDVLDQDVELMQQAGVTAASVGIFSWATLQPAENEFDFDWLDAVVERLHGKGIGIMLATPSVAQPMWLAQDSEVRRMASNGKRVPPGSRHNFCGSSSRYRAAVTEIDQRLAERYGKHPGLLAWHVSNEFGGTGESGHCYCPRCVQGFDS